MSGRVAVVTVTFNSSRDLARHWRHAGALGVDWIVADNASSDGSAELAEDLGARVVRMPTNRGFSAANNAAAALADADCLIFANPDVEMTAEGARRLAALALERKALVAPQLANADGSDQENGRRSPYLYRKFLHYFGRERSRVEYEVIAGHGEICETSWAIGAAIAVPTAVFHQIGQWDEGFFIYYEDSDICLRAKGLGFPTLIDGSVRWTHGWARATRRSFSFASWRRELASAWRFYRRYPALLLHPRLLGQRAPQYAVDEGSVVRPPPDLAVDEPAKD